MIGSDRSRLDATIELGCSSILGSYASYYGIGKANCLICKGASFLSS